MDKGTETEKTKKSLIEKMGKSLLGGENENSALLEQLVENKGLHVDNRKLPAYVKYKSGEKTMKNILRGVCKDSPSLQKVSEDDLDDILTAFVQNSATSLPQNYVTPPTDFGFEELSSKDTENWRHFKKDVRESLTLEMSLDFLKNYHKGHQNKFSEATLIDHIHIILPNKALMALAHLRRQKATIGQIFAQLCFGYGTQKTIEELRDNIYELTDSSKPPLLVLEELNDLLQATGENIELINDLCLSEARRYLKKVAGQHLATTIENTFKLSQSTHFFEFYRIVKINFSDDLRKKKLHHIDPTPPVSDDEKFKEFRGEIIDLLKTFKTEQSNQITEASKPPQTQKTCHQCNSPEHFVRECPFRVNKASRSNKSYNQQNFNKNPPEKNPVRGYAALPCFIHTGGNHNNFNCFAQQGPCNFSPTHLSHKTGHCRRNVNNPPPPQSRPNISTMPPQSLPQLTSQQPQWIQPISAPPQPIVAQPQYPQLPAPPATPGQMNHAKLIEDITSAVSSALKIGQTQ